VTDYITVGTNASHYLAALVSVLQGSMPRGQAAFSFIISSRLRSWHEPLSCSPPLFSQSRLVGLVTRLDLVHCTSSSYITFRTMVCGDASRVTSVLPPVLDQRRCAPFNFLVVGFLNISHSFFCQISSSVRH